MKELLKPEQKHLLWKDEIGDEFVLTKYAEIYRYSDTDLKILCWSYKYSQVLKAASGVLFVDKTDEPLWHFCAPNEKLDDLIKMLGVHKRRPDIEGKYLRELQARLGHKIIAYKPVALYDAEKRNGEMVEKFYEMRPQAV